MLSTVQLNHEAVFETYEINDVSSDRLLASKLAARKLAVSQTTPKQPFDIGGTFA